MNTKPLENWALDIINVIKTVPGTRDIVASLIEGRFAQTNKAMATRIQYALDDAGFTIDDDGECMTFFKIEGKMLAIIHEDDSTFPYIRFVDES